MSRDLERADSRLIMDGDMDVEGSPEVGNGQHPTHADIHRIKLEARNNSCLSTPSSPGGGRSPVLSLNRSKFTH